MANVREISWFLDTEETGLKRLEDVAGVNNNIREWFLTPVGSVADHPSWGNPLYLFQFEPIDESLAVMIEMLVADKMPRDINGLIVYGIRVASPEIDRLNIQIDYGMGVFDEEIPIGTSNEL